MLDKFITSITPNYYKLKGTTVFLLLFVLALFIRLPFFFRDYVDRDESTFILIGQSWVDGFLPYTQLWDVKPPLTFLFFAGVIAIFGKSFIAIRFLGTLLVAITAFFTYASGALISTKRNAFIAAVICVLLQSMFGSIQGVMSEHICMSFFMPALYLLLKNQKYTSVFLSGLLMGICLMSKLNLAYAILLLGSFIAVESLIKKDYKSAIINPTVFGLGILIIVFLTILPYYLNDQLTLWWNSVVVAPLDYAAARRYSPLLMSPLMIAVVLFFVWAWKMGYFDFKARTSILLLLAIAGVLISFIKGGRINSHYLIQLFPILVIPVVITLSKIAIKSRFDFRPYVLFLTLLLPVETYLEYYNIAQNKLERGTFFNGEGFTVPAYINEQGLETKNVLFLGYHIGYWVLGVNPPTKAATHPSNICKDEMFKAYKNPRATSMEELKFIMEDLQPKTVVTRKGRKIFDEDEVEENAYIVAYLKQNYTVLDTVDQAEIYQRLEPH